MLATELDIKKGKLYQLKYKNKRIKCFNSEKLIYLKKLFYIRKGPGVECIQTPEEMIQYLEKINQNKQIN